SRIRSSSKPDSLPKRAARRITRSQSIQQKKIYLPFFLINATTLVNGGLNMHRYFPLLFAATALLLPPVVNAQKVRTDYAHGTDFSKYKTYKWVKISDNPDLNQLMDQRITGAFEAELAKEGLTQSEDNPDLLIG